MTNQPDALTLVMPLRKKEGMTVAEFRQYWLDVHVTLPARYPGLRSVFLHLVSFAGSRWPAVDGVSAAPGEADEFHGVPEATFACMEDLAAFQAASHFQMVDGINFLSEMLAYPSLGAASATLVDSTAPAPDGTDGLLRHLLFLRRRPDVDVATFRSWVAEDFAPALVPQARKVRRHLLEEIEVALDHPGTVMSKPLDRQYQACVEVVLDGEGGLDELVAGLADGVRAHCAAVHAPRVERCIASRYDGRITLAGLRGVTVADLITRLHAENQVDPAVSRIFVQDEALLPA
jgi:hypothetical protein